MAGQRTVRASSQGLPLTETPRDRESKERRVEPSLLLQQEQIPKSERRRVQTASTQPRPRSRHIPKSGRRRVQAKSTQPHPRSRQTPRLARVQTLALQSI